MLSLSTIWDEDSGTKNDHPRRSKPVEFISSVKQQNIIWRMLGSKEHLTPLTLNYMDKIQFNIYNFYIYLLLCFTEEMKAFRFGTTWRWVNFQFNSYSRLKISNNFLLLSHPVTIVLYCIWINLHFLVTGAQMQEVSSLLILCVCQIQNQVPSHSLALSVPVICMQDDIKVAIKPIKQNTDSYIRHM